MSASHLRPSRRISGRLGAAVVNGLLLIATLAGVAYLAPSLFGYERYVITGGSMSGTFEKGSIAFEKPVPVEDLSVGDVITYQPPADSGVTTLVTHRIVSMKLLPTGATQFQTQGDANPDRDPWKFQLVSGDQPVVHHTVPYAGWIFVGLADREIRMLVIGVPAGLIALLSVVELGRALRPNRRDDEPQAPSPTSTPSSTVLPEPTLVGAR
ncbi:signal peptidase I [Aeromicrobium stalagmiti]|uniref:signal peptidase I n=1 Tax=Aeromicrobium stalagmiti TaxID=2738988 RepID=UPI001568DBD6|nr:signal peptidase I [Aeromicrobium stalagmiti]NRQ48504.1 signal peptidase I [Aeromicrobium stalagmiti]